MGKDINQYVIDNNKYVIGKDINGITRTTDELHPIILSIILEIDRVFRKNNIPYALAFGSALGIYNYQGFIPWDDDADIAFDYFDLPRIVEAFNKDLGDDYTFDCYEVDDRYNVLIPTIKVKRKDSYLKEKNHFTLPDKIHSSDGFFVDLVAFINIPNKKVHTRLLNKSKLRMIPYVVLDAFLRINPKKLKAKIKREEKEIADKYKDSDYVCQTTVIPWQIQKVNLYPKDVIYPFKEYLFEGHKLYSFNNIEQFCILRYGNKSLKYYDGAKYVDRHPNRKRKVHHIKKFLFKSDKDNS